MGAIEQFREAMTRRNIVAPVEIVADGKIHRCDVEGKPGKRDASYLLHLDGFAAGGFQNFRDGFCWENWHEDCPLDAGELARYRQVRERQHKAREEETQKRHEAARARALAILAKSSPVTSHPYLEKKQVQAFEGLRLHPDGRLIVPLRDAQGRITTLQYIDAEGRKRYLTGGEKQGCYFLIGTPVLVIYIAEGYATAASIFEATGCAVAVAFDCANLKAVAQALRKKYPDVRIVLCADDDDRTEGNPGMTHAREAALSVGGLLAVPDFGECRPDGATDFNDLHQSQGLDAVARCMDAAQSVEANPAMPSENRPALDGFASCDYGGGRFEVSGKGAHFIGTDKDGERLPPLWMCAPIHIRAKTRDAKSGEWGRLLEWKDDDGVAHQWAMPLELLQGDGSDVRRELARLGLTISPGRKARDLLVTYLQVWPVQARARCVERLGWHGDVYVTPKESIGEKDEIVVFQNAHALEPAFAVSGTLEAWRESVGRLAVGNSRLAFALSVAFAGVLAEIVGEESGGFHLRGASAAGKSTVNDAAASVWGSPSTYRRSWRATCNGLEALAALHNDGVLILDEINQIDASEVGEAAYLLANGQGKARASRLGMARQATRWRLLFLSSGEESLAIMMARGGRRATVGQEIRLADIDADAGAGMGAFEALHGHGTSNALSLALKDATSRYYGTAGVQWLRHVVSERPRLANFITEGIRRFVEKVSPVGAAGQVLRVARRFALVAVAGELATCYGLTGWPEGEAINAARKCFESWLEGFGGAGNREERAMLGQVRAFLEAHGASRFESVSVQPEQRIINRAGFYRTGEGGTLEYLIFPEAFRREVCQGYEPKAVAAAMYKAGWLKCDGKRHTKTERIPGIGSPRFYVLTARVWETEEAT